MDNPLPLKGLNENKLMQIIIADADKGSRVKLAELTKQWGYEVIEVTGKQAALAALQQSRTPVILILGCDLSGPTRVDLCKQAKVMAEAYVLLLNSPFDIGLTSEGMLAGANDYMSIPIDDTEFRVRLDVAKRVLSLKKITSSHARADQKTVREGDDSIQAGKTNAHLLQQLSALEATLDGVGAYVYTKDMQGRYTYANQKVCELFNCSSGDIIGHDDSIFFSFEQSNELKENDALVIQQGETVETEERNVIAKTGETRYYETVKKPLLGLNGEMVGLLGVSTDVTQRKKAEITIKESFQKLATQAKKLDEKKELYELIFEKTDNGIFLLNIDTFQFLDCNQQVLKHLGYATKADILTKGPEGISPAFQVGGRRSGELMREMCALAIEKGMVTFEWESLTQKNQRIWCEISLTLVTTQTGKVLYAIFRDINARKLTEARLLLSAKVFNRVHEAIVIADPDKTILDINPSFTELLGYQRDEIIGTERGVLRSKKHTEAFYKNIWKVVNTQGFWRGEVWNKKKNGELCVCLETISKVANDKGEVVNYLAMIIDITDSKAQQKKLELLAHYDPLTGLPNRALFMDRFNQAVAHSKRSKRPLAMCFIDLDSFKPINDNFGHDIGDKVLMEVAKRISECVREEDTVSRQGGDEFALLLGSFESVSQCEQIMERMLKAIAKPYEIDGETHCITASCGVALCPVDHVDFNGLMRQADQAMYASKRKGKNQFSFFDPGALSFTN
mgnify:CR=1 FL=1